MTPLRLEGWPPDRTQIWQRPPVLLIHMRIPEVTGHAPVPRGILLANVLGNETLVLDDQRNSDKIGKEP